MRERTKGERFMIRKKHMIFALCICAALMITGCSQSGSNSGETEKNTVQSEETGMKDENAGTVSKISEDAYTWRS